ncbi:MAG: phosphatidylserine decarboxylase [Planctomycetota bacterium]|nr:phosphatidylserine decarboxylase [Planctomycetota bacterium]
MRWTKLIGVSVLVGFLSSGAEALGQTATYADAVAPELRELVPAKAYESRLARMQAAASAYLDAKAMSATAASPCGECLTTFIEAYATDKSVRDALSAVVAGLHPPPAYAKAANPWSASGTGEELFVQLVSTFTDWCTWLPQIEGDQDDGLKYIMEFLWLYYRNNAGVAFVQGRNPMDETQQMPEGFALFNNFAKERGAYMDSPASTTYVRQWLEDPRIEIEDYQKQRVEDYKSWNEFFAREITIDEATQTIPSRPVTMPDRDYIISAPTDCIVNPLVQVLVKDGDPHRQFVKSPLNFDMVLDVKNIPISLSDLLAGVPEKYRAKFVGGSGLSCVLMPNTYHHYHAPVSGTIVHAAVLDQLGTWGYNDFPNWVPPGGDVGRLGTDFSQFSNFQRGVVIIEVTYANLPGKSPAKLTGYVASIPVGLDTIGSVVLDDAIKPGAKVKRGYTRLGNFYYGGSLNILLFSKGMVSPAVQSRMGNQIGIIDIGSIR